MMNGREQKHRAKLHMRALICHRFITLLGLLALVLLIAGCQSGPRQIRGEAPLVSLESVHLGQGAASLQVAIRNVNDSRLELPEVKLNLSLDEREIAGLDLVPVDLSVAPRGREVIAFEVDLDNASRELFNELARGQRNNLAWGMELVLDPPRGRMRSEANGFLHPVPGQPGRFR